MTAERWQRLNDIFHTAASLPLDDRAAFLDRECANDPALRAEVERLLSAHDRAGRFIETPALASKDLWPDAEFESVPVGQRFGPYGVVSEIGRGGMGAVYLAERADGHYEQRVALKLIKRGMDIDLVLQRFRAERQILASLEHPNIARLLDGGTTEKGQPYFVMEFIEGEPIDKYATSRALSIPDRLRLFLQICDAVAYAHRHRIIHRDIKPLNILVTADGVPKLLDFGIAKALEPGGERATTAVTGFRLLTPEYASPEQVEGRHATEASDVYSLGVVLYELLTGASPYQLQSREPGIVAEAVRTTIPRRPSAAVADIVSRELRGDLDTVTLVALRKDADRRYRSVEQFADDIRRHLDNLPIHARADTRRYRAAKFLRRNRASVIAASVAVVATTLLASAVVAMRRRTVANSQPSLIATGALAARDRILVADFVDRTGDTLLAAAVTDALRADLAQSPLMQLVTPDQVRLTLERMRHVGNFNLNDSLAHEVAVREGAKAIVVGSLARMGSAYSLSVQLVSAEKGDILTAVRQNAVDSTQLIDAVDRASKALRQRVGESLRELRDMPPLEEVTTASVPALRKYTAGNRLYLSGERTRALKLLDEAVALDSGFALAHFLRAATYEALREPGRALAAMKSAIAHQDRLPFIERKWLIASQAYATGHYETAIQEYSRVLERYPTMVQALNNIAFAYRDARQFSKAEPLWRRAIGLDSTIAELHYGLHSTLILQGKFAEARRTLDAIARRFPDDRVREFVEVQDAAARHDWAAAEKLAKENVATFRDDTLSLIDVYAAIAGILMTQGRLAEAERQWRTELALSSGSESFGRYYFGILRLAYTYLRYRNAPRAARAIVDSALMRYPLDSMLAGDRPYDELARFYAAAGDRGRAHAMLAAADINDRELGRTRMPERAWTRGVVALADGRVRDAEIMLREAAATHLCAICPLPDLARTYEAVGRPEAAIAAYERYVSTPWLWRYEIDAIELGRAMKRLGELHDQRREHAKAAAAYSGLLNLWRDADEELRAQIDQVKRRRSELQLMQADRAALHFVPDPSLAGLLERQ